MNTAVIKSTAKELMKQVEKHSPEILAGLGVVSIVSTAILAIKATPKAQEVLEEARAAQAEIPKECDPNSEEAAERRKAIRRKMAKEFCKIYWKTATSAALGATAIIFSNRISNRRNVALAGAYALTVKEFADFKETAKEMKLLTDDKEKKIKDKVMEKKIDKKRKEGQQVIFTGKGDDLFIDEWSGQIFKSSVNEVEKAVNNWNAKMLNEDQVTLNDLYYELGIPEVPAGDLGFESAFGTVSVMFGSSFVNDKAYITMSFDRQPMQL